MVGEVTISGCKIQQARTLKPETFSRVSNKTVKRNRLRFGGVCSRRPDSHQKEKGNGDKKVMGTTNFRFARKTNRADSSTARLLFLAAATESIARSRQQKWGEENGGQRQYCSARSLRSCYLSVSFASNTKYRGWKPIVFGTTFAQGVFVIRLNGISPQDDAGRL